MDEAFPHRVLVCGGRAYSNAPQVRHTLLAAHQAKAISLIIEGWADGADNLARMWAKRNGIPCLSVPADWQRYGKAAGPARNAKMLKLARPHLVIAFPGGAGTADMVSRARAEGIEVEEIRE